MQHGKTQHGVTLIEMLVVLTIMTIMIGIGLPAFKSIRDSFESGDTARAMISSALASARAMAAQKQQYVGVRFQEDLDGYQYMIFVEHDYGDTELRSGMQALTGIKPIRLPESVRVMDLRVRTDHGTEPNSPLSLDDEPLTAAQLDDTSESLADYGEGTQRLQGKLKRNKYLVDASTFTIVFSKSSGLVVHGVRVRNRQGKYQPETRGESSDAVFNSPINIIDHDTGRFIQDDYAALGLGAENSRNALVICDKQVFDELKTGMERYAYLAGLPRLLINRYTGTIFTYGQ